jgi:hypothetical protein
MLDVRVQSETRFSEKSMTIPRSLKTLLPSLRFENSETATVNIADLNTLLPSVKIKDGSISLSVSDLRKVIEIALSGVKVDEKWYLGQVPELRREMPRGKFQSVSDHYYAHGYLEGRLPERPAVDEYYYLRSYPDVADAVKAGQVKSAFDHYIQNGYREGRLPMPPKQPGRGKEL